MGTGMSMMSTASGNMNKMGKQMDQANTKLGDDYIKQMKTLYNQVDGTMDNMMYMIRTSSPELKNYVWPWNNFDFDYSKYIYNKYEPANLDILNKELGTISGEGYLDVTQNNLDLIAANYRDTLRKEEIPNNKSVAGTTGKNNDGFAGVEEVIKIKKKYNKLDEPYKGFKKDYKYFFENKFNNNSGPTGKYASSYFIKSGNCPVPGINNVAACKSKGFTWNPSRTMINNSMKAFFPGTDKSKNTSNCFKPRYAFIDNSAGSLYPSGSGSDNGMIPTIAKTMSNLNPIELSLAATYGRTSDGSYYLLPCNPNGTTVDTLDVSKVTGSKERFANKTSFLNKYKMWEIIILLFIIFSILYVIFSQCLPMLLKKMNA